MIRELHADFHLCYPAGPTIEAQIRQPADGFHVTTLLGPSGCGKTTVLRALAGLARPSRGQIQCGAETWFHAEKRVFLSPQRRNVGYLLQDYALFPHLTVAQNVNYGLRTAPGEQRKKRTAEMLSRFGLSELAERYPYQVSGGQQQRVALARVLARRPNLLLLDEPLSALDSVLREELRRQLRRLLNEFDVPVVLVTHERTEAIAVSDQIIVMESGRLLQSGKVEDVFSHPVSAAVARIVGVESVLAGEVERIEEGLATVRVAGRTLVAVAPNEHFRHVHVCIRGEDVILQRGPHDDLSVRNQLSATVKWLAPEGALVRVGLDCGFELTAVVTRTACQELGLREGDHVTAAIKAPSLHLAPRRP